MLQQSYLTSGSVPDFHIIDLASIFFITLGYHFVYVTTLLKRLYLVLVLTHLGCLSGIYKALHDINLFWVLTFSYLVSGFHLTFLMSFGGDISVLSKFEVNLESRFYLVFIVLPCNIFSSAFIWLISCQCFSHIYMGFSWLLKVSSWQLSFNGKGCLTYIYLIFYISSSIRGSSLGSLALPWYDILLGFSWHLFFFRCLDNLCIS